MRTFRKHLNECLKDDKFKQLYEEEKELIRLSLALQEARKNAGISQNEIAQQANLTQQQVSKLENGENCTIMTYLKASKAVGFMLSLQPRRTVPPTRPRRNKRRRTLHLLV
jgi:HTH-type transcriptional regulator/antitoxin HipB